MFYNTGIGTYIWVVTNRKESHRKGKIQLVDARERFVQMRRSLGNKRRELSQENIRTVVREYGEFIETPTCKIFDNTEFGYHRVTVERPLRLVYTMSLEGKERFLNAYPHLLDDVQAIDQNLGRTPREDWNAFDRMMTDLLKKRGSKWKSPELKAFRNVFAEAHADALPVIVGRHESTKNPFARIWGWFEDSHEKGKLVRYEANTDLRDNENIGVVEITGSDELSKANEQHIVRYIQSQVIHHVKDAWADRESVARAYEINFNRYFYTYKPPRPLEDIDNDIKALEQEILQLLREVTE
jgi:type I restriction enzyme M protein